MRFVHAFASTAHSVAPIGLSKKTYLTARNVRIVGARLAHSLFATVSVNVRSLPQRRGCWYVDAKGPRGLEPDRFAMTSRVQPGTILLGKYRVEKELGHGAMGYVVAARHDVLNELFAVKLMLPEALEKPDAAGRFLREARACARLKSEHVVRVTDSGEHEPGVPAMVMEYLVGEDLQSLLDKRTLFPLPEAVLYVLQACDAIAEAHEIGIVHRDLKPSNLFLTRRSNGKPCVKVLDFGISKDLNTSVDSAGKLTATGSIIGTPYYMSPEQMQAQPTDSRGDIWSIGVILYEFVTGKLPFPGDNYASVAGRALYEQPWVPSRHRPGLPPEFDAIVMRCLEKQPDKRFGSVRELMAVLEPLTSAAAASGAFIVPDSKLAASALDADKATLLDKDTATIKQPDSRDVPKPPIAAEPLPAKPEFPAAATEDEPKGVTSFYAKRVFGHQAGKTWASNSRAGRSSRTGLILFAIVIWALVGAGWYYREKLVVTIREFALGEHLQPQSSTEMPDAAAPITSAPLASPSASGSVSALPHTAAPRVTSKPGSSPSGTHSAKSPPPLASSATPSPSAAKPPTSAAAPAPSAAKPPPTPTTAAPPPPPAPKAPEAPAPPKSG